MLHFGASRCLLSLANITGFSCDTPRQRFADGTLCPKFLTHLHELFALRLSTRYLASCEWTVLVPVEGLAMDTGLLWRCPVSTGRSC